MKTFTESTYYVTQIIEIQLFDGLILFFFLEICLYRTACFSVTREVSSTSVVSKEERRLTVDFDLNLWFLNLTLL